MTDEEMRAFSLISGLVAIVGVVLTVILYKNKKNTRLSKIFRFLTLYFTVMIGALFVTSVIFPLIPSLGSERFFNLDPVVREALAVGTIEKNLPEDTSTLKEPWALITVKMDENNRILSSSYGGCSAGNFLNSEDVAKLRTIIFAKAYAYDTVYYQRGAAGSTIEVPRQAGVMYFYDTTERMFKTCYYTGPVDVASSYTTKPHANFTADHFMRKIRTILTGNYY